MWVLKKEIVDWLKGKGREYRARKNNEKQIRIKDGKELENAKERQEIANIADNTERNNLEKMK